MFRLKGRPCNRTYINIRGSGDCFGTTYFHHVFEAKYCVFSMGISSWWPSGGSGYKGRPLQAISLTRVLQGNGLQSSLPWLDGISFPQTVLRRRSGLAYIRP